MKKIISIAVIVFLCVGLGGCNKNSATATSDNSNSKVRVNGSTSMEKLLNGLAELVTDKYPQINIEPQFTGSSAGIEALVNKTADIASSSRAIKDSEKEKGVVENIVAYDGIAVIVYKESKVKNLTKEQLSKIYRGEINNWKQVGGENIPIVVIGREAGSGTRTAFEELLGIEDECKYVQEIDSTGAVVAKVGSIQGAIGYVSLDVINKTVEPISIDGIEINEQNIKNGTYLLQRPFVMATLGDIGSQNENIKTVFDYIYSQEGQKFIQSIGLVGTK